MSLPGYECAAAYMNTREEQEVRIHCYKLKNFNLLHLLGHPPQDQLGALGLVTNMITLWNTLYIEKAVKELRSRGMVVHDEDIARLSPLVHAHINMLGKYSFYLDDYVKNGELRPLRELNTYRI